MSKDISGRELKVGQRVAFCLGGSGTAMRIGVITDIGPKTVLVSHYIKRYRNDEPELTYTRRAFGAVSLIANEEED